MTKPYCIGSEELELELINQQTQTKKERFERWNKEIRGV